MTPENLRVILIGGTSHAGKSTAAQMLALRFGWNCQSTDKLAKHPGRPWRTPPKTVPDHVREHYLAHSPEALLGAVLGHYRENVIPHARTLIAAHSVETSAEGLVLEGSALLPEFVAELMSPSIAAVWLMPTNELIEDRIRLNSDYRVRSPEERAPIDAFLARTHRYNDWLQRELHQRGLPAIDPGEGPSLAAWVDDLILRIPRNPETAGHAVTPGSLPRGDDDNGLASALR